MFNSLKPACKDLAETIVLSIHLFNISKGFECTGLQEDDPVSSELLPESWNRSSQLYSFRYTYKSLTIYQKSLRITSGKLSIHTVRNDQNDKVFQHSISIPELNLAEDSPNLVESLITSVLRPYEEQVLQKFLSESASKPEAKSKVPEKGSSLLEDVPNPRRPEYRGPGGIPNSNPYSGPFTPANPFSPFGHFPGNRVGPNHPIFQNPPGARWDPPDPFYMPPDPDHFPPPGPFPPFNPFGRGGYF